MFLVVAIIWWCIIRNDMACKIDCEGKKLCFDELVGIDNVARCEGLHFGCYNECPEGSQEHLSSYGTGTEQILFNLFYKYVRDKMIKVSNLKEG